MLRKLVAIAVCSTLYGLQAGGAWLRAYSLQLAGWLAHSEKKIKTLLFPVVLFFSSFHRVFLCVTLPGAPWKIPRWTRIVMSWKPSRFLELSWEFCRGNSQNQKRVFVSFTDPQGEKKQPDFMFACVHVFLSMLVCTCLQMCVEPENSFQFHS